VLSYIHIRTLNTDPHIIKISVCSGSYVGYSLYIYRYKYIRVYVFVSVYMYMSLHIYIYKLPCIFIVEFHSTVSTAKVFVKIMNKISL